MLLRGMLSSFLMLVLLLMVGCGREQPAPQAGDAAPRKVRLLLNWFPEHQHGGYYTALLNGYYAEEGLDVEIVPGGPQAPVLQRVGSGQVEFGITNADQIIFGRAAEAPVVGLFAPQQNSPRCLMVHEESGIRGFEDIRDMTLAMNSNDAFAAHLMRLYKFDDVKVVRYPGNLAQFLGDKTFGQQAYSFSEPILARQRGANPRLLMLSDTGYNPYTSVLFTRESLIREDAEVCEAMVRASLRGWREYMADPAATNQHIASINPELEASILAEGVEAMRPLVFPEGFDSAQLGRMIRPRWRELVNAIEASGQIDAGKVSPDACYNITFLERIRRGLPATNE